MKNQILDIKKVKLIIFDFDGVLTNNKVYINERGEESVICDRADGLAFRALKMINLECIILSTEKNKVVSARGRKLGLTVFQGVKDKLSKVIEISEEKRIDLREIMFIGNDINDLSVIKTVGISACPSDSHPLIKQNATFCLSRSGGDAIAREIVEELFNIDIQKVLKI